jgi:hypothetical protein
VPRRDGSSKRPYLGIVDEGDRIVVSYCRAIADDAVLRYRVKELVLRLRGELRHCGKVTPRQLDDALLIVCEDAGRKALPSRLERAERMIDELAGRPLTPRMVVEILGITQKERLRWSNDGRLTKAGAVIIKAAAKVAVTTYSARLVAALAATPTQIEQWRTEDAAKPHSGT